MNEFEQEEAQQFLRAEGVRRRRSVMTGRLLTCVACMESRGEEIDFDKIGKCRGIQVGTLYPMVNELRRGGVFGAEAAITDEGSVRIIHSLSDSPIGKTVGSLIVPPAKCLFSEEAEHL